MLAVGGAQVLSYPVLTLTQLGVNLTFEHIDELATGFFPASAISAGDLY